MDDRSAELTSAFETSSIVRTPSPFTPTSKSPARTPICSLREPRATSLM